MLLFVLNYKFGLDPLSNRECGFTSSQRPTHWAPMEMSGLMVLDDEKICWLTISLSASDPDSLETWNGKRMTLGTGPVNLPWEKCPRSTRAIIFAIKF